MVKKERKLLDFPFDQIETVHILIFFDTIFVKLKQNIASKKYLAKESCKNVKKILFNFIVSFLYSLCRKRSLVDIPLDEPGFLFD